MDPRWITFTSDDPRLGGAEVTHRIPIRTCHDHAPGGEPDEETPKQPHTHSRAWGNDLAICLRAEP